jgi:hypothetical protein
MSTLVAPAKVSQAVTTTKAAVAMPPPAKTFSPPVTVLHSKPKTQPRNDAALKVSSPNDAAEKEATNHASRIAKMPTPMASPVVKPMQSPHLARMAAHIVQRESAIARVVREAPVARSALDGQVNVSSNLAAEIKSSRSSGMPLPPSVRRFMEPRFGLDFGHVRMHVGDKASKLNREVQAKAFTLGSDIFFGEGQFKPESSEGRELIAHELTHTVQQGPKAPESRVHRSLQPEIRTESRETIQRGWLPDPMEYIAEKAGAIPGFTMFTVVIGFNPITRSSVDRNAGNILRGAIELIPGGYLVTQALDNHGIFDKISAWTLTQFNAIKDIGSNIWQAIKDFVKGLGVSDLGNISGAWERGKAIVTGPIDQMIAFAINLKDGIVNLIKESILKPIGAYAKTTRGYPLLCAVMGSDPITGEAAPQDAETLMGAFLTFVGEGETWATMKKANAIPRAFAWFKSNVAALKGFVAEIPALFVSALKSLELLDIILIPRAFIKLGKVFGNFAGRFISWGANAVWNLLEIIFDVVKPGAMAYVKRTGAALRSILRNPLPFVGNLVKAAKLGFQQFGGRFLTHLKAGLLNWLTGSLPGVYIPKALTLPELGKLAISVLGVSWAQIRAKIVKALGPKGEAIMKGLETAFDIVKTLVTGGPAAAWELIKDKLATLKDTIIDGIIGFVRDTIIQKAIPKLIAMFIPGAGFISAIISIYDTVMVFVQKISKIIQVVTAFIDSIVSIAGGAIGAAANRVESILANLLSLAISFLAGFVGLGKVSDKIMGVIGKVRATVDKALDAAIKWIVSRAKAIIDKLFGGKEETPEQKQKRLEAGSAAALAAVSKYSGKKVGILVLKPLLALVRIRHRLTSLEPIKVGDKWSIRAEVNPVKITQTTISAGPPTTEVEIGYESHWPLDEFMSKANAIKRAAEGKTANAAMTLGFESGSTTKQKSTKELRVGGQEKFRTEIHQAIDKISVPADQASARGMMSQLQADHQQELQMGGTDKADNMAMIESRMNSQMGAMFRGQLKNLAPETKLDVVKIETATGTAPSASHRPSGTASALQSLLLKHAPKIATDAKIRSWFKL